MKTLFFFEYVKKSKTDFDFFPDNLPYLFFNLLSEKEERSNLEIRFNFGRVLYLNELSYHTQIGRIWKSKHNFLKWDQSGYGSFIHLDLTVKFMVIFWWFW